VTLVIRRFFRHSPAVVWNAISDPDQVRQWFLTSARIDGKVGGSVDLVTGPTRVHATGRILAWEPPRLYEYQWNVAPQEGREFGGEETVVRWELTPHEGGTLLVLSHRDLTQGTAKIFDLGMQAFLDRLEALMDGCSLPDWETRIREIHGSIPS